MAGSKDNQNKFHDNKARLGLKEDFSQLFQVPKEWKINLWC